jgi:hypothetical protein
MFLAMDVQNTGVLKCFFVLLQFGFVYCSGIYNILLIVMDCCYLLYQSFLSDFWMCFDCLTQNMKSL